MHFSIYQDYLLTDILHIGYAAIKTAFLISITAFYITKTAFLIANIVRYRLKICFFMVENIRFAIGNAVMVAACPACLSRVVYPILNVRMDPFPVLGLLGDLFHFHQSLNRICEQTVETLIRHNILRHLIWVSIIFLCPIKGQ